MSARRAIEPLAKALRDRSYTDYPLQPRDLRNLALGLEDLAKRIDGLDSRLSLVFLVVGVIIGVALSYIGG